MERKEDITILDNVLNEKDFNTIQEIIFDAHFPWYFNGGVVYDNESELNNYQFTHCFYKQFCPHSEYYELLFPIIKFIDPISILRIKANLLTKSENIIEHGFHTDIPYLKENQKSTTAIFYVNTNNGYTKFEDGTKIKSVANRLISFDSRLLHTGSTCTDEKRRVVINFNYF